MIRHISIPAHDPAHVADVLAELMGGRAYPFPGSVPDAFMAVAGDAEGHMIEVYPYTTAGRPGEGDHPAVHTRNDAPPRFWPFHVLMTVPLDEEAVLRIGAREGWRARRFGRGAPGGPALFDVIELWIENNFLIEIATADMVPSYERTYQLDFLDAALTARA